MKTAPTGPDVRPEDALREILEAVQTCDLSGSEQQGHSTYAALVEVMKTMKHLEAVTRPLKQAKSSTATNVVPLS